MINALGSAGLSQAIDALRADRVKASAPATRIASATSEGAPTLSNPASELAAQGAPIDSAKVATIRAAIAGGSYKVDAQAIADRMIALDLPAAR